MKRALIWALCLLTLLSCTSAAFARSSYTPPYSATAYTDVYYASTAQLTNIQLAVNAIDGVTLTYGQYFSFNDIVGPRTYERGYVDAVNGRGADVIGGGVAQVATTLMLAVNSFGYMSEEEYMVYGDRFTGGYVSSGDLAVVTDYANDHDYAFTSWYDGAVTIEAWISGGKLYVALTGYNTLDYGYTVLGEGSTPMPYNENQATNIRLCYTAIDDVTLSYGQKFSFNSLVGPRTAERGYKNALNGRGVKVTGGGVAQVASTIYLAAKSLDCVVFDTIHTYGERYTGAYVSNASDAIVTDYNAGTDFSFTYYGAYKLEIKFYEMNDRLYCQINERYN